MTLSNPDILWALLLLFIPLAIHFFTFRKYRLVEFSNLELLANSQQSKRIVSTINRWLVLLLRLLLFGLLILAFAQPNFNIGESNTDIGQVVYLDNSPSSERLDFNGLPILYAAIPGIDEIRTMVTQTNRIKYYDNSGRVFGKVKQSALGSEFSSLSVDLSDIAQQLRNSEIERLNVFSDFQLSTLGSLESLALDSSIDYVLNKLPAGSEKNIYIDSVWVENSGELGGLHSIHVAIVNASKSEASGILVKIYRDEKQVSSEIVSLSGLQRVIVTLALNSSADVAGNYRVLIDDPWVLFDNEFYFVIPDRAISDVLVIVENDDSDWIYLRGVFGNGTLYNVRRASIGSLNIDDIRASDLVVLSGLKEIPIWLQGVLNQVMDCRILLIPSIEMDIKSYSSYLGLNISINENREGFLANESLSNPFLNGVVRDKGNRSTMPRVNAYLSIEGHAESVLSLDNGDEFCIRTQEGIYLLTSPLEDEFTNFHKHALFVPTMYNISQSALSPRLYLRIGEAVYSFDNLDVEPGSILRFANLENSYIVDFSLGRDGLISLLPEEMDEVGFYKVFLNDSLIAQVALNHDLRESQLETVSDVSLERLAERNSHISFNALDDRILGESKSNKYPYWKYILVLGLLILVSETLILRFVR